MIGMLWNTILVNPLLNVLAALYHFSGSLGIAIILMTVIIKALLIPVITPSLKTMKKQRDLQPELDKLKEKYKYDKKKMAEMQMELFKKHGLNPASGCLTQVAMIVVLIALYGVIRQFTINVNVAHLNTLIYFPLFKFNPGQTVNSHFWIWDLAKADRFYILALLSGVLQFFASKMMLPYVEQGEKAAEKTPDKKDDIAYNMQAQMVYTMPVMNFIIGMTLPAGVVLYIVVSTVFSIVQQYFVSGWGGLNPWIKKVWKSKKN
ncbi:MAG TPA: YidC/Oxa1 family membrane protein insertase [Candidatus Saccharimonadales bacterium]|nr:YidC/Oxa1 family membrane protein insertase [Candidatus Saccharimonadales bacterium]